MQYKAISLFNVRALRDVTRILHQCGLDMYDKYGLKHWKNSLLKTFAIVIYSKIRNRAKIVGVFDQNGQMVASYMYNIENKSLRFTKFAVHPKHSGKGMGSLCLESMEHIARENELEALICEVFDKSEYALRFYLNKGFRLNGETKTLKYTEINLIKPIQK